MSRRLKVILGVMMCATLLSGCQLAKEETELQQEKDKLIGVYVTTEYVDTFDFEGFMEDNLEDIMKGEEMFVEQDKKRSCKRGDVCVADRLQSLTDGDAKSQLNNLSYILSQNPQNYKELINIKNQIQKSINTKLTNELKDCEQR